MLASFRGDHAGQHIDTRTQYCAQAIEQHQRQGQVTFEISHVSFVGYSLSCINPRSNRTVVFGIYRYSA